VILAGRRVNDAMGEHVAHRLVRAMLRARIAMADSRVLVMGLAFKENCPDTRNTRVVDVVAALTDLGVAVDVWDPLVDPARAEADHGIALVAAPEPGAYDAILLAVSHRPFVAMGAEAIRALGRPGHVFFDLKSVFPAAASDLRL
jgi:UDP-N-acetyl-D-glucosamine/UDP-N-acetyl-D-galactosamine dehydrogenase